MKVMYALVATAALSAATAHGAATVSVSSFTNVSGTGYRFTVDPLVYDSYDGIRVQINALPGTEFANFTPGFNARTTNSRTGAAGGDGSVATDPFGDPTGFTVLPSTGNYATSVTDALVDVSMASLGNNNISSAAFTPMAIAQVFIPNGFDFGGTFSFTFRDDGQPVPGFEDNVIGTFGNVPPPVVPEPSTGLVVLGLAALAGAARRANLIG